MPVPRAVANFNRRVTNPIQRLWAPHLPLFALIEHTGRKSGKAYTTPVTAFVEGDKIIVMLNYGQKSDWVRNIRAAGSAGVIHRGTHYKLTGPRIIPSDSPDLPRAAKLAFGPVADGALYATITKG
ncbi:nitroreductase family deazaflavin-dependent oxidoreductase [Jongsikchunia kroppenstedtii]|uniref:nitroreductase family deazaflavin-dependent oxidoreductase n=1 Tax=Jongsikchunia kroppenstedtii TaxID=1121721 RepID=UPI000372A814|nr:nitroreductase family deazaflavin-dependent oxidoreductase [Jongsikchunia kroppenstedtii]